MELFNFYPSNSVPPLQIPGFKGLNLRQIKTFFFPPEIGKVSANLNVFLNVTPQNWESPIPN